MLEQQSLILLPWQDGPDARAWIVEPGTSAPLGFVRRQRPSGWLRWLRRSFLAIHESEDEPLLMTLHSRLGPWPTWLVRDADDHHVGRICGRRLLDGLDHPVAELDSMGRYRNREQQDLAVTVREEEGVRLTFLMPDGSPFVKMVILAAALVHNQDVLAGTSGTSSPRSPASPSLPTGTT